MSLNAVSEDIRTLLHNAGKGVQGVNLFSLQWGSGVDGADVGKQILVRDTTPIDALIKDEYENPVFEILVRGDVNEGMLAVHDRARDIYEFMIEQVRQTLNGTEYVEFAPVGGMIPIGKDANNRPVYSMTFFTYRDSIGA